MVTIKGNRLRRSGSPYRNGRACAGTYGYAYAGERRTNELTNFPLTPGMLISDAELYSPLLGWDGRFAVERLINETNC